MPRLAALVAGALWAGALLGCGGDDRRESVEKYIQKANAVQREFADDFKKANDTYVAYAKNELKAKAAIRRLGEARSRIADARAELAALEPPADARALHAKLLQVYDLNGDFAEQTALLAAYLDGAADVLAPLEKANRALRRGLRKRGAKAQAKALQDFVMELDGVIVALRMLDVPRVLLPTHRDQIAQLQKTRRLSARLRSALVDQDSKRLARALKKFRTAGEAGGSPALARRAIRQYEQRYKDLNEAYAQVQREQTRLQQELG